MRDWLSKFPARAQVVLTALPARLALVAGVLAFIADNADILPDEWQQWVLAVVGATLYVINAVRKLSPVPPEEQGVLPKEEPVPQ